MPIYNLKLEQEQEMLSDWVKRCKNHSDTSYKDFESIREVLTKASYVYVIGMKGKRSYFKIGVSCSPKHRLDSLQSGNPFKLSLVKKFGLFLKNEAFQIEALVHSELNKHKVIGEWFNLDRKSVFTSIESAIKSFSPIYPKVEADFGKCPYRHFNDLITKKVKEDRKAKGFRDDF